MEVHLLCSVHFLPFDFHHRNCVAAKCKKEKQPLWWQEMILFPVFQTETETGRVSEFYKANSRSELKRIIESPRIQSQHFFVLSCPLLSLSKTFLTLNDSFSDFFTTRIHRLCYTVISSSTTNSVFPSLSSFDFLPNFSSHNFCDRSKAKRKRERERGSSLSPFIPWNTSQLEPFIFVRLSHSCPASN